jgi:hypothetical protein
MTTYAEKLLALAVLRGDHQARAVCPRPFAPVESRGEWSGGQLLTVRAPETSPAPEPGCEAAEEPAPKPKRNYLRMGQYRRPRPGGVTWTLLRLAASGDCFDRHDVEEECSGDFAKGSIGTLASKLCRDGLAKVVVKGGWWVPPGQGWSLARPTTWRGTPKAQRVWALTEKIGGPA